MMTRIQVITSDVITLLNKALVQYQLKEQQSLLAQQQEQIKLLQAPKPSDKMKKQADIEARTEIAKTLFEKDITKSDNAGFIYAYKTEKYDYIIKLGKTRDPDKRLPTLKTSQIDDSKYIYIGEVHNRHLAENMVHATLDEIPYLRYTKEKEFFRVSSDTAKLCIDVVTKCMECLKTELFKPVKENTIRDYISGGININNNVDLEDLEKEDTTEAFIIALIEKYNLEKEKTKKFDTMKDYKSELKEVHNSICNKKIGFLKIEEMITNDNRINWSSNIKGNSKQIILTFNENGN